jgi:Zn-dependent protease
VDYRGVDQVPGDQPAEVQTGLYSTQLPPWQHGHFRQNPDGAIVDVPIEKTGNKGRWGLGGLASIGLLVAKYGSALKFVLPALFKFKFGLSLVLNVGVYAILFAQTFGPIGGIAFAAGFVALIFVHEMGHLIAARAEGVKATAPFFIPFMGAAIFLQQQPRDARSEAVIGIGGPITGTLGAIAVYATSLTIGDTQLGLFFAALASYGFLINLFNMIPMTPFDGGRVLGAVSKWFNVVGLLMMVALIVSGAVQSPFAWLFAALGAYGTYKRFSQPERPGYYEISAATRAVIGVSYLALLIILVGGLAATEGLLQSPN